MIRVPYMYIVAMLVGTISLRAAGTDSVRSVREWPILPYVYFDLNNSDIPGRYVLLHDATEADTFSEDAVHGKALDRYHQVLNIVGRRLRTDTSIHIRLIGCVDERNEGRNRELAIGRARVLMEYFSNVWRIDMNRMSIQGDGRYPETKTNPNDSLGTMENMRCEIRFMNDDAMTAVKPMVDSSMTRVTVDDGGVRCIADTFYLILFGFDHIISPIHTTWTLKSIASRILPTSRMYVHGSTDVVGDANHNRKLSTNRARVIHDYLVWKIKRVASYTMMDGRGEDGPLYDNTLPEGRAYNRTVEIIVRTPLSNTIPSRTMRSRP